MSFTTPIYGLRYPALTEPPNGPDQVKNLALDVENKFAANDAKGYALGILAQTVYTADGASGSSTEVAADAQTFTLDTSRQYEFEWQGCVTATSANPYMNFTFRIANGSSASTSSPLVRTYLLPVWGSSKFHYAQLTCPVKGSLLAGLGLTSGQATVRLCAYITAGNGGGTWAIRGAADDARQFTVKDAGINR